MQLPGQVVGVLNGCVGPQAVGRRVPVHGVADAENPAAGDGGREMVVHRPGQPGGDPHLEVVGPDQLHGQLSREFVSDLGRAGCCLVAPHEHPLMPRLDHPQNAEPDALLLGARLQHPVQDRRAVRDEAAQVGLEDDMQGAADGAGPFEGEAEIGRHQAARPVGADQVLRPDRVDRPGQAVLDLGGHPGLVLHVREVLRVEAHLGAAGLGGLHHHWLGDGLRRVQHRARALQLIVGVSPGVGAPGRNPAELVADQAGAEGRIAHVFPGRGLAHQPLLQAHVPQGLHGALVGDVRAGRVRQLPVLGHDQGRRAVGSQEERDPGAAGPGPHDEDVGAHRRFVVAHGVPPGRIRC